MNDTDVARIGTESAAPPVFRRPLAIGVAVGIVALIASAILVTSRSGPPTLALTFEGTVDDARCTYDGPAEIAAGEVSLSLANRSDTRGTDFIDVVRVHEGRTVQDVHEYLAGSFFGRPAWTTGIWTGDGVAGGATASTTKTLGPGLYVLVCGSNDPYAVFFGSAVTVTP